MSKVSESVIEKPLLCNAEMVRAILDGRKTNTRRPMEPQPDGKLEVLGGCDDFMLGGTHGKKSSVWRCPFGKPGDRLWVRECFAVVPHVNDNGSKHKAKGDGTGVTWRADWNGNPSGFKWKPSIHMPRWASRINLEITDVRVERVQEISKEDAIAEGIESQPRRYGKDLDWKYYGKWLEKHNQWSSCPINSFESLWNAIYGVNAWDLNPWVWVVAFKKV